jgi:hypothetical protein
MNVKVQRQDASGWVGAHVKILEGQYKGEEAVVTNSLPGADGETWSLHVRPIKFPHLDAPLVLAPSEVERVGFLN